MMATKLKSINRKNIKKKLIETKKILKAGVKLHKMAFRETKLPYLGLLITGISISILPFLNNWLGGKVIDQLIFSVEQALGVNQQLISIVGIYIIALTVSGILGGISNYFEQMLFMETNGTLTIKMQKAFSKLDFYHHENPKFNDTLKRAQESYEFRPGQFLYMTLAIINDLVMLLSSLIIILSFAPLLVLLLIFGTLPNFIIDTLLGRAKYGMWQADSETRRDFWHTLGYLEDQKSLSEIKTFRIKQYMLNLLSKLFYEFYNKQKDVEGRRSIYMTIGNIFSALVFGFAYWVVVDRVLSQAITIGTFTFYIATIRSTNNAIGSLLRRISHAYENGLYMIDIFKVLDTKPKIVTGQIVLEDKPTPPLIAFKNVWFKYPKSSEYVFKGLNFEIKPGENLAVVGENGAGKSTFVKLLSRFYDVDKGQILIDKIDIKDIELDSWYSKLALLSQDFARYHFDAKTNIGLGDKDHMNDMEKIIEAAKLSGADEFIKDYKKKYNQVLNKRFKDGIEPSTGQWQKIALARAFFKDPQVLILDEPTSAIDPKAEAEIFDKLFDYAREKSVIIISHRFSTVRNANRIIVLDKGKIIEDGTHQELIKLDGKYKNAYELQKRGYQD